MSLGASLSILESQIKVAETGGTPPEAARALQGWLWPERAQHEAGRSPPSILSFLETKLIVPSYTRPQKQQ